MGAQDKSLDALENLIRQNSFLLAKNPKCPNCQDGKYHISRSHAIFCAAACLVLSLVMSTWVVYETNTDIFDALGYITVMGFFGVMIAGLYVMLMEEWMTKTQHQHILAHTEYTDKIQIALKLEIDRVRDEFDEERDPIAQCIHELDFFLQQAQNHQYYLRTAATDGGRVDGLDDCLGAIARIRKQRMQLVDYRLDYAERLLELSQITNAMNTGSLLVVIRIPADRTLDEATTFSSLRRLKKALIPAQVANVYHILSTMTQHLSRTCRVKRFARARKRSFKGIYPDLTLMEKTVQHTLDKLSPLDNFYEPF